jgi:hypothetical protein
VAAILELEVVAFQLRGDESSFSDGDVRIVDGVIDRNPCSTRGYQASPAVQPPLP